jgi:hypothetical protein
VREQRWLLPLVWFTVKTSIVVDSATICVVVVVVVNGCVVSVVNGLVVVDSATICVVVVIVGNGCVVSVVNGLVVVVAISSLVYDICDSVDGSE